MKSASLELVRLVRDLGRLAIGEPLEPANRELAGLERILGRFRVEVSR